MRPPSFNIAKMLGAAGELIGCSLQLWVKGYGSVTMAASYGAADILACGVFKHIGTQS